ncbi:hypothetical protein J7L02_00775 [Candidatus Woesearchaeota archaeon]|nr:hypothetical protein [Candidatus Woesearchaeota archaeon]
MFEKTQNKAKQNAYKAKPKTYEAYIDPEQQRFAESIEFEQSLKINNKKQKPGLEALI